MHLLPATQLDGTHSQCWKLYLVRIDDQVGLFLPHYLVILFSSPSYIYIFWEVYSVLSFHITLQIYLKFKYLSLESPQQPLSYPSSNLI